MTREDVIKGLELCTQPGPDCATDCPYVNASHDWMTCTDVLMTDALALLKEQETQDDDADFMTHIICEICDYAVKNEMEPNDTLLTIADNIKTLLKISTFNNWKVSEHRDGDT